MRKRKWLAGMKGLASLTRLNAMGFIDFIKGKGQEQAQPEAPKQQTPKQAAIEQAAIEQANRIPPTPSQLAKAQEVGEAMRKATQHLQAPPPASSSAPADSGSNAALLQKQAQLEKAQEALSPTDDAKGKTATQAKPPVAEKTTQRSQQTSTRRPPSWER